MYANDCPYIHRPLDLSSHSSLELLVVSDCRTVRPGFPVDVSVCVVTGVGSERISEIPVVPTQHVIIPLSRVDEPFDITQ